MCHLAKKARRKFLILVICILLDSCQYKVSDSTAIALLAKQKVLVEVLMRQLIGFGASYNGFIGSCGHRRLRLGPQVTGLDRAILIADSESRSWLEASFKPEQ